MFWSFANRFVKRKVKFCGNFFFGILLFSHFLHKVCSRLSSAVLLCKFTNLTISSENVECNNVIKTRFFNKMCSSFNIENATFSFYHIIIQY